jgi:hypothetical protein
MDIIKEKICELMENQRHILEAVKYLNERMKIIDDKEKDNPRNVITDFLESQAMLDEIVKSSDNIVVMKKTMEEN